MNKIVIPKDWAPMGRNKYLLVNVAPRTPEFQFVQGRFGETVNNRIQRIQRIQNPEQWKRVRLQEEFFKSENRNPKVRYMFHGTRQTDPSLIYDNHIGFDFRFSAQGNWGVGAYFAHNASYSHGYRHGLPNGNSCMFFVQVIQGDSHKCGGGGFRIPPFKNGVNGARFDSVSSVDDTIVIVYEHSRAYPYYLIEYN